MTEWIGAAEAAQRLGIKPASLYSYVSRGVLSPRRGADGRASMFDAADIDDLARRGLRRAPGGVELVIESVYKILALNTEKAHNVREKALEAVRMARSLAEIQPLPERDFAFEFEEPPLLTLGLCYEQRGRFSGGAYHPVLKRIDAFLDDPLPRALEIRAERAQKLFALDDAVTAAVEALRSRGLESPYLRAFVVARINPLRFKRSATADYDATIDQMLAAAKAFDATRVRPDHLAKAAGPPAEG